MVEAYGLAATLVIGFQVLLWLASVALKDASLVDRTWGLLFVLMAAAGVYSFGLATPSGWVLFGLCALWGVRLSVYLTWRNWGHGEDHRYVAMRKQHGAAFWWVSLFTVFLLQGGLALLIGAPLLAGMHDAPTTWHPLHGVGVAIFAVGFFFEAVGDAQLVAFKARGDSAGKVLDTGLWRYTRHPNYFGNATLWWGLFIVGCAAPLGPFTVFGPALMTFLLLKVSGVVLLEKSLRKRRPDYAAYVARTSSFIPWPPKAAR